MCYLLRPDNSLWNRGLDCILLHNAGAKSCDDDTCVFRGSVNDGSIYMYTDAPTQRLEPIICSNRFDR